MTHEKLMPAITLKRPWPYAILHLYKRVENRSWKPPPWLIGRRLAIHAGKTWDAGGAEYIRELGHDLPPDNPADHPAGVVVATARLTEARYTEPAEDPDPWAFGPWLWVLSDVRAVIPPIEARGQLGVWRVPARGMPGGAE